MHGLCQVVVSFGQVRKNGGSFTSTDCEVGKVSDTGEVVCRSVTVAPVGTAATYFVKLTLLFPLAESEFTTDKHRKLRESIAAAVGAKPTDVTLTSLRSSLDAEFLVGVSCQSRSLSTLM